MSKVYHDLLEIIEGQNTVIESQNKTIAELVNDNLEKENYIKEMDMNEQK